MDLETGESYWIGVKADGTDDLQGIYAGGKARDFQLAVHPDVERIRAEVLQRPGSVGASCRSARDGHSGLQQIKLKWSKLEGANLEICGVI